MDMDITGIAKTRHQKWKDNVKNKFVLTYKHNASCTDNKEAIIWLLYGPLV